MAVGLFYTLDVEVVGVFDAELEGHVANGSRGQ